MSGVEVFGIAASVVQVANTGAELSVKLFKFARTVRHAAQKLDAISKEIAATGALLQQLGKQLEKSNEAQILRPGVMGAANDLVQECARVFGKIKASIDGNPGQKVVLGMMEKLHYAFLDSEIEALRMNLEKLKSNIAIMQGVLIYAEQLRNKEEVSILKDQMGLLRLLHEEKVVNDQRSDNKTREIEDKPHNPFSSYSPPNQISTITLHKQPENDTRLSPDPSNDLDQNEVQEYISLVEGMLGQVHSERYNLREAIRLRARNGVLDLHWQEWAPYRRVYADTFLLKMFNQLPELLQFWANKIEEEKAADSKKVENVEPLINSDKTPVQLHHEGTLSTTPASQVVIKSNLEPKIGFTHNSYLPRSLPLSPKNERLLRESRLIVEKKSTGEEFLPLFDKVRIGDKKQSSEDIMRQSRSNQTSWMEGDRLSATTETRPHSPDSHMDLRRRRRPSGILRAKSASSMRPNMDERQSKQATDTVSILTRKADKARRRREKNLTSSSASESDGLLASPSVRGRVRVSHYFEMAPSRLDRKVGAEPASPAKVQPPGNIQKVRRDTENDQVHENTALPMQVSRLFSFEEPLGSRSQETGRPPSEPAAISHAEERNLLSHSNSLFRMSLDRSKSTGRSASGYSSGYTRKSTGVTSDIYAENDTIQRKASNHANSSETSARPLCSKGDEEDKAIKLGIVDNAQASPSTSLQLAINRAFPTSSPSYPSSSSSGFESLSKQATSAISGGIETSAFSRRQSSVGLKPRRDSPVRLKESPQLAKDMDIQLLLSQWTTLSPLEIARANDHGR